MCVSTGIEVSDESKKILNKLKNNQGKELLDKFKQNFKEDVKNYAK